MAHACAVVGGVATFFFVRRFVFVCIYSVKIFVRILIFFFLLLTHTTTCVRGTVVIFSDTTSVICFVRVDEFLDGATRFGLLERLELALAGRGVVSAHYIVDHYGPVLVICVDEVQRVWIERTQNASVTVMFFFHVGEVYIAFVKDFVAATETQAIRMIGEYDFAL